MPDEKPAPKPAPKPKAKAPATIKLGDAVAFTADVVRAAAAAKARAAVKDQQAAASVGVFVYRRYSVTRLNDNGMVTLSAADAVACTAPASELTKV